MNRPPFKNSELGPIPADWEVKQLGEIGTPLMCKRVLKSQTADSGEIPFYKIGTFGQKADAFISRDLFESFKRQYSYPKKGDILLSAAGTIGRCIVFDGTPSYFQDSNIVWLANDERIVCNEFLYWLYQVAQWQTENGGSVSRLYNDILCETKVIVPPLAEQRCIAAALSDVDAWIESLDKLIEKKKLVKQGAMQALLSGKTRLPGFSGEWVERRLGEVAMFPTDTVPTETTRLSDYVGTENMLPGGEGVVPYEDTLPYENIREYRIGDVLISNIRPYLKKIWLADRNGGGSTDVVVIRTRDKDVLTPEFLFAQLAGDSFFDFVMDNAIGTKMPRGDKRMMGLFAMPVPSLAEQQAIASVLSDMDAELAALSHEKAKAEQIKQGMMQELLTGRTRLGGGE